MPDLILAEALLLVALDDDTGADGMSWGSDTGLAGALLLDLVRGDHVREEDGRLVPVAAAPSHPVLRAAHEAIAGDERRRKPSDWVSRLPRALKPMKERLAEGLVARGVLEEERRKRLGLFETVRYPTADPEPERELRAGLREVLLDGREPTADEALLLSLIVPLDLAGGLVGKPDRKAAKRRAKEVADRNATGDAVRGAIEGTQAAIMVAVMAATTATTTTTITS